MKHLFWLFLLVGLNLPARSLQPLLLTDTTPEVCTYATTLSAEDLSEKVKPLVNLTLLILGWVFGPGPTNPPLHICGLGEGAKAFRLPYHGPGVPRGLTSC